MKTILIATAILLLTGCTDYTEQKEVLTDAPATQGRIDSLSNDIILQFPDPIKNNG